MKQKRFAFVLVLALVCGGTAAYLALNVLADRGPAAVADTPKGRVLVAVRDLQVGSVVSEQDIAQVEWPTTHLPANAFSAPAEVVGRGLITPIAANEPFLRQKLSTVEEGGGLPILIPAGMRALSVKVDQVIGVAGFVLPGTRVDVLLTLEPSDENRLTESITRLILQDIRALAAGQTTTRDAEGTPQTVSVVTLLVSPEEAEKLTLAASEGKIQLALRNTLDGDTVTTRGAHETRLLDQNTEPVRPAQRVRVGGTGTTAPATQQAVVETIRGGQRTLSTFSAGREQ